MITSYYRSHLTARQPSRAPITFYMSI